QRWGPMEPAPPVTRMCICINSLRCGGTMEGKTIVPPQRSEISAPFHLFRGDLQEGDRHPEDEGQVDQEVAVVDQPVDEEGEHAAHEGRRDRAQVAATEMIDAAGQAPEA